ncbi:MAG: thioredoxin family protein [Spirochaetaceae bacterium]|nr:thioredoxin family protein [Spirochaetaceae bacterium]MDT8299117.1 thioredoxin family protein [Spirochaetaceae bacterium]
MKRIFIAIALAALSVIPLFADYPPTGWTDSITEAIQQAEAENKMILLDFTGSDWCEWCHRLENEVWSTSTFENWSEDNVVKVFLDFPRAIDQEEDTKLQNQLLQQMLGVQGYPTVWLLDSDLTPLLRTGYREGGADEYIRHLTEDQIAIAPENSESFRQGFRSGIEEYLGPIG